MRPLVPVRTLHCYSPLYMFARNPSSPGQHSFHPHADLVSFASARSLPPPPPSCHRYYSPPSLPTRFLHCHHPHGLPLGLHLAVFTSSSPSPSTYHTFVLAVYSYRASVPHLLRRRCSSTHPSFASPDAGFLTVILHFVSCAARRLQSPHDAAPPLPPYQRDVS
ncbi:hypothetical protein PYCCODRAFT_173699 [Trametes coccinea BRFM310]|uniref:Uncharacterized protein n=1 Tax=Trametes coccinea (strain BRFM310) TaxID=1353009 RepID=A0A1Y2ITQ9_TRAC3|nr:hypothetical protein PYCCODRAFT_173699 [Trametes coccinea BRFM310]